MPTNISSVGFAVLLWVIITMTAFAGELVLHFEFGSPLFSWFIHDVLACGALCIYCGYELAKIKGPRAWYVPRRTLIIAMPMLLGIGLAAMTGWYACVELGMLGTLIFFAYQIRVAEDRGYKPRSR